MANDRSLTPAARRAITAEDNDVLVSAASGWEFATKYRLRRFIGGEELADDFEGVLQREAFGHLPITMDHALRAGNLPGPHKDPFDRMLVSQAIVHGLTIVTPDPLVTQYPALTMW